MTDHSETPDAPEPALQRIESAGVPGASSGEGSQQPEAQVQDTRLGEPGHPAIGAQRTEPRLFAFLWSVYLIIVIVAGTAAMGRGGFLSASALAPRARLMLIAIAAGATIACPMVRLSQARAPARLVRTGLFDVLIVVVPIQVVLWPLKMLVDWPWDATIALAVLLSVWPLLVNSIVGIALAVESGSQTGARSRGGVGMPGGSRAVWMVLCLAPLALGPVWIASSSTNSSQPAILPVWVWFTSPFTAIYALTGSGLSGPTGPVAVAAWTMLGIVAGLAAMMWTLAAFTQAFARERRGRLH